MTDKIPPHSQSLLSPDEPRPAFDFAQARRSAHLPPSLPKKENRPGLSGRFLLSLFSRVNRLGVGWPLCGDAAATFEGFLQGGKFVPFAFGGEGGLLGPGFGVADAGKAGFVEDDLQFRRRLGG